MNKTWMRLLAGACAMTMGGLSAYAAPVDSVRQDNVNRRIVISGSMPEFGGREVTVAVLPADQAGKDSPEFSDFSYLKQVTADKTGVYQLTFEPGQLTGDYVVRIFADGMTQPAEQPFAFYSFEEAEACLPQINSGDAGALKTLLESNRELLGIASPLYLAMLSGSPAGLSDVYSAVAAHSDFATLADFVLYFEAQLRIAAADKGGAEAKKVLVAENPSLWDGLKAYQSFQSMNQGMQELVYEHMGHVACKNDADIGRDFAGAVLLAQVQSSGWQDISGIFGGGLDAVIGLDLTNYSRYPSEVAKAVAGERFGDIPALQNAINSVTGGGGGASGGSGGGSGGNRGGSEYINQPPLTATPAPVAPEEGFRDLGGYEWAQESILALADKGIVSGVGDNRFAPEMLVTREEFVTLLMRAFPMEHTAETADFADVPGGAWYEAAVAAAQENEVVSGVGGGFFGVGRPISRQDMAKMAYGVLVKARGLEASGSAEQFGDGEAIAAYAREAVGAMAELGIINGFEDGCFHPEENADRAQAAKIIYGMLSIAGGAGA